MLFLTGFSAENKWRCDEKGHLKLSCWRHPPLESSRIIITASDLLSSNYISWISVIVKANLILFSCCGMGNYTVRKDNCVQFLWPNLKYHWWTDMVGEVPCSHVFTYFCGTLHCFSFLISAAHSVCVGVCVCTKEICFHIIFPQQKQLLEIGFI